MEREIKEKLNLIRAGDNEAAQEMINDFRQMINSMINAYTLNYGDYVISREDLFQEGCIALLEACKRYQENDKAKFSTFAFVVIERRLNKFFFKSLRRYKKEYSLDKYDYIDHLNALRSNSICDNPLAYSKAEDREQELNKMRMITEEDRKIIKLRAQNYSYKEIADMLNISTKRIDNRLARVKRLKKERSKK